MPETGEASGAGQPKRRLLAATDLSSRSDRALRRAGLLASALGAELLLLHAVDDDQPRSLVEAERREAWALLRQQAAGLPELQAAGATPLVEEGDPFEAILRIAEARAVDLAVLGEHRRRPLRDIFVGTTVERVMRHGRHPVLMVNQPPAAPYRRILAATDLSDHAARALRTADRLGLLAGADLTLLHAFEPLGMGAIARANLAEAEMRAHTGEAAQAARAGLDRFAAGLAPVRAPRRLVEEGRPATVVKAVAERLRPDLLVIGTAGAGGLRRALLGSVAAEVLAAIACDALVVPPEEPR